MKHCLHTMLILALVWACLAFPPPARAQDGAGAGQVSESAAPPKPALPPLSEIITLSATLQIQLAVLENEIAALLDPAQIREKYLGIGKSADNLANRFKQLQGKQGGSLNAIIGLNDAVRQETKSLDAVSLPLESAIERLGASRETWLAEKSRWGEWQRAALQERGLDQLRPIFREANRTINKALNLVLPRLDAMFRVQEKGADISVRLNVLAYELDEMITQERRGGLVNGVSSILSIGFFAQFLGAEFWNAVISAPREITWPDARFLAEHGWIVLFQIALSAAVIAALRRNRALLENSRRLPRIAQRTFSTGLFIGYVATMLIYEHQGASAMLKQVLSIVGAVSLSRIWTVLVDARWKKNFIYLLMILLVCITCMEMFNFPLALMRLFTIVTSIAAILFFWRWARESSKLNEPRILAWGLSAASLFFAVVILAELTGKVPFSFFLLASFLRSVAVIFFFILVTYIITECIEWIFHASIIKKHAVLHQNANIITRRVTFFLEMIIHGLLVIPSLFVIWGAYDTLGEAARSLLSLGFNVGSYRISVGLLIIAAAFVYFSFLVSWILQNLLLDAMLLRRGVERGVRASIKSLAHYLLISVGFLLAVASLGLELTKLTILLSALGVGIGFGLQGIVNNFVSGLILLFERPVRVGDYIELNGNWCEIQRIGLRATTVQTFDQADVVIPNADLVANQVTNWTLRNRIVRVIIPVGVAYGSDIPLVIKTLGASAVHPMVADNPAPQVLFLRFGESSLDFELRVWVVDVDQMLTTRSELHQEIDRRFREANIEIAFPQRDVHLRSAQPPIPLPKPGLNPNPA